MGEGGEEILTCRWDWRISFPARTASSSKNLSLWPCLGLTSEHKIHIPALTYLTSQTSASRMLTSETWSFLTLPHRWKGRRGPTQEWGTCTSTRWPPPLVTAPPTSSPRKPTG